MMDYLVLYQSLSGNTKRLAAEIFSALPGNSKDLIDISECKTIPEANIYFVGFGVYYGTCHLEVNHLLSGLSGKAIALFATCGMGNSTKYGASIEKTVSAWIEGDTQYLGAFICQGKMPIAFRNKLESKNLDDSQKHIDAMLGAFDSALTHPDKLDMEHAKVFVAHCLEKFVH